MGRRGLNPLTAGRSTPRSPSEAPSEAPPRRLVSSAPIHRESHPARPTWLGSPELGPGSESAKESNHQENFSAEEALPEEDARVPGSDGNPRRSPRPQASPSQGKAAPDPRACAVKTKHRLRRPAEFEAVRAERKDAGDYLLRVQVRPNALGHPRFGVVVTRRQGGSVVRNRLRRRLQAAARSRLCSTAAYDIVLTPRRAAQAVEFEALCASLAQALEFTGAAR